MNHLLFAKQTAKVCGSSNYILPLTSSANGGSEPSIRLVFFCCLCFLFSVQWRLILSRQLEALAESLTRVARFFEEKCGRSDRKETRCNVDRRATCMLIQVVATMPRCEQARLGSQKRNQGIHSLVPFFVSILWRRTTCCLLRKQQKFAVVQIIFYHSLHPQTVVLSPVPVITNYNLYLTVCLRLQPQAWPLILGAACGMRSSGPHENMRSCRPKAATGLIQVVFYIFALSVRAQFFYFTWQSPREYYITLQFIFSPI